MPVCLCKSTLFWVKPHSAGNALFIDVPFSGFVPFTVDLLLYMPVRFFMEFLRNEPIMGEGLSIDRILALFFIPVFGIISASIKATKMVLNNEDFHGGNRYHLSLITYHLP